MTLTAALGRWQLARAAQKQTLQAAVQAQGRLPPLTALPLALAGQAADARALLHRSVRLRGRWVGAATVYLDNRQMQGRPGFYVLSPLRLEGTTAVVLVQRGWVARNFAQRETLPPVQTPEGVVTVNGRLTAGPARLYAFEGREAGLIRQNLDIKAFSGETGLPLLALSVEQTGEPSEGLRRDWPEPASGVEKHQGYAFQWFALCGLIGVLYVWFQWGGRLLRHARAQRG